VSVRASALSAARLWEKAALALIATTLLFIVHIVAPIMRGAHRWKISRRRSEGAVSMTPPQSEENEWRGIVAWLLRHPERLTKPELLVCQDLISLVFITEEQRAKLTSLYRKATGGRDPPEDA
jgi:hypothetical protein